MWYVQEAEEVEGPRWKSIVWQFSTIFRFSASWRGAFNELIFARLRGGGGGGGGSY